MWLLAHTAQVLVAFRYVGAILRTLLYLTALCGALIMVIAAVSLVRGNRRDQTQRLP